MPGRAQLTAADVTTILQQGAQAAIRNNLHCCIAVSDREGYILGVYFPFGPPTGVNLSEINAIDKAGASAYLSSDGEAFSSRTGGFIIQSHFPPGIDNTAPGPLTGVGLSSLPFSDVNHFRNPANPAAGIANTSLSGNPGGVPLYKNNIAVGAVGVDSNATLSALVYVAGNDTDEQVATSAQFGYRPGNAIIASNVLINGIRLAYITSISGSYGKATLNPAFFDPTYPITASPGHPFNVTTPSPFSNIPDGTVRNQIQGSNLGPVNGVPRLTQAEVLQILHESANRAQITRAAIRSNGVPAAVFIVVVDYYNPSSPPGTTPGDTTSPPTEVPEVLGSFRTPDATIFSYDVAAQKARTALFFSNNSIALSSRSVGFLAQGTYPPGINNTAAGPYGPAIYGASNPNFLTTPGVPVFNEPADGYGMQFLYSIAHNSLQGATPTPTLPVISNTTPPDAYLPNGITVFPGGFPLYKQGQLIGAVGVSGDGVDQDDIISASGTVGFEAPMGIRADEYEYRGARLPYAKFPQNATLSGY